MDRVSQVLMRAIARGLSLEEHFFDQAFEKGLRRCVCCVIRSEPTPRAPRNRTRAFGCTIKANDTM